MSNDKAEKRRSSRACLECRLAKTKCHVTGSKFICDRCAKFSFECRFVRHHRGRKPVSKLASIDADDPDAGVGSSRLGASDDDMGSEHDSDSVNEDATFKSDSAAVNEDDFHAADDTDGDTSRWDNAPPAASAGASTAAEETASAVTARYPRLPETLNLFGPKDPVDVGILSMAAAHRLYAYYFEHLNPWGMNFDPYFVSHDAVRASSSFLYSTILYLGSRYIELAADETHSDTLSIAGPSFARPRPDDDRITTLISAQLGSHVRSLAITAFAMGDRRMETGVAMYLSSVWKEADDHFTILYCSYAAKIMSDIPTELLSLLPSSQSGSNARAKTNARAVDDASLHQQRLRRNQQRQFLFHFIQEHTQLLHFAPRPNFDRGPSLLRNLLAWADDGLATEDDVLLCADIDSVLLQTKYKSIMERAQAQEKDTLYGGSECFLLLQSFMDELEGWTSRWELQARKIDQRFRREVEPTEEDGIDREKNGDAPHDHLSDRSRGDFAGHLPLDARMHLLSVMRSSLVMQISSIAFRASLRDINKAKPTTSSKSSNVGSSSAFSPSALSAMDDRAEQIYYTCLDSALNLLVHTTQLPPSILRHAQDMIMVLAPHAALLATYLISLPLPSVPPNFASSAAASERLSYEYAKVKTRIRRRKEYERKCLELMRDTRESFRAARVRADDHVELCAGYFDSLLNVIEGDSERVGAGTKRSRSAVGEEETERPRSLAKVADVVGRASSAGPHALKGTPNRHHATSTMDTSAAETLLNLHAEQPSNSTDAEQQTDTNSPARLAGYYGPYFPQPGTTPPSGASGAPFSPGSFSTGMFGHFAPTTAGGGAASPHQAQRFPLYQPQQQGGFDGFGLAMPGTVTPTAGTGTSTPVDWTWLQSFLDVPEFSWM
uniref:Zn(2)-C6 fungal-type domain-containing protein n=1 Tax=Kalmanozyma brasiliensis (strain GHG001) TaxID=1365824 RepID=V5GUJ2_KALBG